MNKKTNSGPLKVKDIVSLALLALVLVVVGSFAISKLGRGGQPRTAQVEIVFPIDGQFDEDASVILRGQNATIPALEVTAPVNFSSGLGNNIPFGP